MTATYHEKQYANTGSWYWSQLLDTSAHWRLYRRKQHDYKILKKWYANGTNPMHIEGLLEENIFINLDFMELDHQA